MGGVWGVCGGRYVRCCLYVYNKVWGRVGVECVCVVVVGGCLRVPCASVQGASSSSSAAAA